MTRLGVALITVGLALAVFCATRLVWMIFFDPTANGTFMGILSLAGMLASAILAVVGVVFVIKHSGQWTPPL